MAYSKSPIQKQESEIMQPSFGDNAARTLPAVPVLQKANLNEEVPILHKPSLNAQEHKMGFAGYNGTRINSNEVGKAKSHLPTIQRKIIFKTNKDMGKWGESAEKLLELITTKGQGSIGLREVLIFINKSDICHLQINLKAAKTGTELHGDTGIYVLDNKMMEQTLIQEQIMKDPWMFIMNSRFVIEVNVYCIPGQNPVQAATTLLHELELHAIHAGHLLMQLNQQLETNHPNINKMINDVMTYQQQPDEHLNFDRLVQFIVSAAGIRDCMADTPWGGWAQNILVKVGEDAIEKFMAAKSKVGKITESEEQINTLIAFVNNLLKDNSSQSIPANKLPKEPSLGKNPSIKPRKAKWSNFPNEVALRIQILVLKRIPLSEIVTLLFEQFGVAGELTLDLYRNEVIPWLMKQIPKDATPEKQMRFLYDHGVPNLIALDNIEEKVDILHLPVPYENYGKLAVRREIRTIKINNRHLKIDPDEIPNDGNCLFNSIIAMNAHGGKSIRELRELAHANGARAAIKNMGEWADEDDIAALAKGLGIRIVLISLNLEYGYRETKFLGTDDNQILIAHIFGGHFTPMRK